MNGADAPPTARDGETEPGAGTPTRIGEALRGRGERLAVAESCTGGGVSDRLTDVAGASKWLRAAVVAYTVEAKADLLGVDRGLVEREGAVSAAVAEAMARGALTRTGTTWALATTGFAGPTGGTATEPIGAMHVAVARAAEGGEIDDAKVRVRRHAVEDAADAGRAGTKDRMAELALEELLDAVTEVGDPA